MKKKLKAVITENFGSAGEMHSFELLNTDKNSARSAVNDNSARPSSCIVLLNPRNMRTVCEEDNWRIPVSCKPRRTGADHHVQWLAKSERTTGREVHRTEMSECTPYLALEGFSLLVEGLPPAGSGSRVVKIPTP